MATTLKNGFQAVFGSSPKEAFDIESRFQDVQEKLGHAYGAQLKVNSEYWSNADLDQFLGAKWTSCGAKELANLSDVWIKNLVDKENMHRLPELTAYLALHYPQVDDYTKPAVTLLNQPCPTGTVERCGFSDCHLSEAASGSVVLFGKKTTIPDYVRFRAWYDALPESRRSAFACFLALSFVRLCNKSVDEMIRYLTHHAMHDFQRYWGVPANNLLWIPTQSVNYLKSYFQPCSQLLVTVLAPFLRLRKQLIETSTYASLLDSLDLVLFSPTQGKELELVQLFQDAFSMYDLTEEQLLAELPFETAVSRKRLGEFIRRYSLSEIGTWFWARYFSKGYFVEYLIQHNRKATSLLSALAGGVTMEDVEDGDSTWVEKIRTKYGTRKDRASSACFEGFWDGARRLDYA